MKNLSNYTYEEFKEIFKTLPCDMIQIVYDYYHRDKSYTVGAFALKKHISTATLYRYINIVKLAYKRHCK